MNSAVKGLLSIFLAAILIVVLFNYNMYIGLLVLIIGIPVFLMIYRAALYAVLGNINYAKGEIDKALGYFEKAYRTGKCKASVIISYGYLLLKTGKVDESEKILNSVFSRKLSPDEEMVAKSNLALVLWKKGNIAEAAAMLEEVFENYKNTTVYGSLGYMLILKGDLEKALKFNLEAYEYNGTDSVILDNLGQTYYFRGEYDKAEEIYEKIMETNPKSPGIHFNYGLVLAGRGQVEKALELMRKALSLKITFLSGVTEEEIKNKIEQLEAGLAN